VSLVLPGWDCPSCGAFCGKAKERLVKCRACGAPRPQTEELTMLDTLTIAQTRGTELKLELRAEQTWKRGGIW